jgi:dUTP pyrophosphatase
MYFLNIEYESITGLSEIDNQYRESINKKTTDSGFDLFMPNDVIIPANQNILVDLKVRCEPKFTSGYYLYPRSSLGKTPLRLANSVGIIDNGYRGTLKVWVHNTNNEDFYMKKGERYFQLCHPSLEPMTVCLTSVNRNTERGEGGFGSTGK